MRLIRIRGLRAAHAIALVTGLLAWIMTAPAMAAVVDFTVKITDGPLDSNSYTGTLSYDESKITGSGAESVTAAQGLTVSFDFIDYNGPGIEPHNYTQSDDSGYNTFPRIDFLNGTLLGLTFGSQVATVFYMGAPPDYLTGGSSFVYLDLVGDAYSGTVTYTSTVPLPAALPLLASALLGLGVFGRRTGSIGPG